MGGFLRLIGRIIAVPFIVVCTIFLSFMGIEVKDPTKKREEEREQRPEGRMQVAGDQDDDDKRRRWHFDRKDAEAYGAIIQATVVDENSHEPRIDFETWATTRKIRKLGQEAAYAGA